MASFSLYLEAWKNPESAYNSASVPDRADLIVAQSKLAKGLAVEEDVAKVLAKLNYRPLQEFRNAGNQPFDTIANKSSTFDGYRARLETLSKQNPIVTKQLTDFFNKDKGDYESVMRSLAGNINTDPQFAEAIIGKIEKNPGQTGVLFARYAEALDGKHGGVAGFIAEQKGARPEPAAVVAGAGGGETTQPKRDKPAAGKPGDSPARQQQLQRINKLAGGKKAPSAIDDGEEVVSGTATLTDRPGTPQGTQTAAQQFDALMASPQNKAFADYARGKKVTTKVGDQTSEGTLYDAMRAAVDKDHKKLRSLNDPAQMKNYLAMMSDDKVPEDQRAQAIIAQFRGDPPPGLMEQGQAMMEQMKKDHPGLAKFMDWGMDMIDGFFHKGGAILAAMGGGEQAGSVISELRKTSQQGRERDIANAREVLRRGAQGGESDLNLKLARLTLDADKVLRNEEKLSATTVVRVRTNPDGTKVAEPSRERFDSWAQTDQEESKPPQRAPVGSPGPDMDVLPASVT